MGSLHNNDLSALETRVKKFSQKFDPSNKFRLSGFLSEDIGGCTTFGISECFSGLSSKGKKEFINELDHIFEPGLESNVLSVIRCHIEDMSKGRFLDPPRSVSALKAQAYVDEISRGLGLYRTSTVITNNYCHAVEADFYENRGLFFNVLDKCQFGAYQASAQALYRESYVAANEKFRRLATEHLTGNVDTKKDTIDALGNFWRNISWKLITEASNQHIPKEHINNCHFFEVAAQNAIINQGIYFCLKRVGGFHSSALDYAATPFRGLYDLFSMGLYPAGLNQKGDFVIWHPKVKGTSPTPSQTRMPISGTYTLSHVIDSLRYVQSLTSNVPPYKDTISWFRQYYKLLPFRTHIQPILTYFTSYSNNIRGISLDDYTLQRLMVDKGIEQLLFREGLLVDISSVVKNKARKLGKRKNHIPSQDNFIREVWEDLEKKFGTPIVCRRKGAYFTGRRSFEDNSYLEIEKITPLDTKDYSYWAITDKGRTLYRNFS
jgi:hypothetical protein